MKREKGVSSLWKGLRVPTWEEIIPLGQTWGDGMKAIAFEINRCKDETIKELICGQICLHSIANVLGSWLLFPLP